MSDRFLTVVKDYFRLKIVFIRHQCVTFNVYEIEDDAGHMTKTVDVV